MHENFGNFLDCPSTQNLDKLLVNCTTGFAFLGTKLWTDPWKTLVCPATDVAKPVVYARNETTGHFRLSYTFAECNPSTQGIFLIVVLSI